LINVALIGYGYWGPNLARNFHSLPECRLIACCDINEERLKEAQRLYPGLKITTDFRDLLKDDEVDAVAIATPVGLHYSIAREALLHGKHVLVEKPMTTSVEEARDLVELANRQGKVLMAGHTFEYNPAVLKMKELISRGEIGAIYYIHSTRVNLGRVQKDLNALWSIAPHDISILLFLLEVMPQEVSARGATYLNSVVEDVVFIHLVFPHNVIAHVHVSWLDPCKVRKMTVVGSKKMIVYDDVDSEAKIRIYDKGVFKIGNSELFGEFQYKVHSGDIHIPRIDLSEPLRNECQHFIHCIREGKKPLSDGESGLRVVKVLEAAQKSLKSQGTPVKVE